MHHTRSFAAALSALLCLVPMAAGAQVSVGGIELSGGYYLWGGDNVEELEGGLRGQLTGFTDITSRIAFGITVLYGQSGVEGLSEDAREVGAGGVLRISTGEAGATHLFVDGTLAWSRLTVSTGPVPVFQEDGILVGPTLGLSIPVGEGIRLLLAGDVSYNRYGEVYFEEAPFTGSSGDGAWHYGVRVGIGLDD